MGDIMELFEHASYLKLRFETSKGELATEDLWALSLQWKKSHRYKWYQGKGESQ